MVPWPSTLPEPAAVSTMASSSLSLPLPDDDDAAVAAAAAALAAATFSATLMKSPVPPAPASSLTRLPSSEKLPVRVTLAEGLALSSFPSGGAAPSAVAASAAGGGSGSVTSTGADVSSRVARQQLRVTVEDCHVAAPDPSAKGSLAAYLLTAPPDDIFHIGPSRQQLLEQQALSQRPQPTQGFPPSDELYGTTSCRGQSRPATGAGSIFEVGGSFYGGASSMHGGRGGGLASLSTQAGLAQGTFTHAAFMHGGVPNNGRGGSFIGVLASAPSAETEMEVEMQRSWHPGPNRYRLRGARQHSLQPHHHQPNPRIADGVGDSGWRRPAPPPGPPRKPGGKDGSATVPSPRSLSSRLPPWWRQHSPTADGGGHERGIFGRLLSRASSASPRGCHVISSSGSGSSSGSAGSGVKADHTQAAQECLETSDVFVVKKKNGIRVMKREGSSGSVGALQQQEQQQQQQQGNEQGQVNRLGQLDKSSSNGSGTEGVLSRNTSSGSSSSSSSAACAYEGATKECSYASTHGATNGSSTLAKRSSAEASSPARLKSPALPSAGAVKARTVASAPAAFASSVADPLQKLKADIASLEAAVVAVAGNPEKLARLTEEERRRVHAAQAELVSLQQGLLAAASWVPAGSAPGGPLTVAGPAVKI